MLNTLHIKNFTVFQDARFEFSPGLNVIVGDNGTGKTHVETRLPVQPRLVGPGRPNAPE